MYVGDKTGALRYATGKLESTITAFNINKKYATLILKIKHPLNVGLKRISASDIHVIGGKYRIGVHANKMKGFLKYQVRSSGIIIIP